jgi:hypothetical protein
MFLWVPLWNWRKHGFSSGATCTLCFYILLELFEQIRPQSDRNLNTDINCKTRHYTAAWGSLMIYEFAQHQHKNYTTASFINQISRYVRYEKENVGRNYGSLFRGSTVLERPWPPRIWEVSQGVWTSGKTPWTSDQPIARPLPTQENTTQKDKDRHPCLQRDSNLWSKCPSNKGPRPRPHGPCDWQLWLLLFLNPLYLFKRAYWA